jgi:hypothetical protein
MELTAKALNHLADFTLVGHPLLRKGSRMMQRTRPVTLGQAVSHKLIAMTYQYTVNRLTLYF